MSSLVQVIPPPVGDRISRPKREGRQVDPTEGLLTQKWLEWFTQVNQLISLSPAAAVPAIVLTSQSASIAATDLSGGALRAGLYRVSYYARITTPGGVSSSLTIAFDWTDGGATPTYTGAAMTGNAVTTVQEHVGIIRIDGASPIRYSTTYASVGAPAMQYRLDITLEELPT